MDEVVEAFFAFLFCVAMLFLGFAAGYSIAQDDLGRNPSKDAKITAICEYLHAKHQGNVCVKNGVVVYPRGK